MKEVRGVAIPSVVALQLRSAEGTSGSIWPGNLLSPTRFRSPLSRRFRRGYLEVTMEVFL